MDMQSTSENTASRTCVNCGVGLVLDAIYCHRCGTKQPPPDLTLTLITEDDTVSFTLNDPEKNWVVGRTIEPLEHYVDIDLAPHGGKAQGVSRTHATFSFDDNNYQWQLQDEGSQFGTFIDEQQLETGTAKPLITGQQIRFGGIALSVTTSY